MSRRAALAVAAFAACAATANYLTARYGLVPVGFGLMATAGTYAAGLALLARDAVHEVAGWRWVFVAVAFGAALSWATSSPRLAIASTVAFALAELADLAVYAPLRRHGWARAAVASGFVGSLIDTLVFLTIAGFPITTPVIGGQMVGKALWATLLPVLAVAAWREVRRRALPGHPLHAEGA